MVRTDRQTWRHGEQASLGWEEGEGGEWWGCGVVRKAGGESPRESFTQNLIARPSQTTTGLCLFKGYAVAHSSEENR